MKTRLRILCSLVPLLGALATTSVFGQPITYVWTNQNPANLAGTGDMNVAANWNPNGNPTPMTPTADENGNYGDLLIFDGQTTGPLKITQSGGTLGGFGGQTYPAGVRILLTPNQTSPLTIYTGLAGTPASPTASGGLRMNSFTIEAGAGGFSLGINSTTNILDILSGEQNGQVLGFTNNSSVPAVINPDVKWRLGGAGAHPHIFAGTGDWFVNNHMRSQNSSSILVQKFGLGTMTWTGTNVGARAAHWSDQLGAITIGEGTMIWKTSDLVGGPAGNPNIAHNGTLFKYDVQPAPGLVTGPGEILGTISGTGAIEISAGTLTLSGQNTLSGSWTLSGGTLVAGSAETEGVSGPLGVGGTISFAGGTLRFSGNNTYDYSPRFSTAAGQQLRFDTAGQTVMFTNTLTSSGGTLTKLGPGTLTLAGTSSYSGETTVSAGRLVFEAAKTGSGNITVANGASLGVTATGAQVTPGTLAVGTSTLDFNNVNSTTTAPLAASTLSASGTITFNVGSGTFAVGQSYPLLAWTSGPAPAVSLGVVIGAVGNLSTNGNTIQLNVTELALIWSGANNGAWDITTLNNWRLAGVPATYADPLHVAFDDTASGATNVTISGVLQPSSVSFNNNTTPYSVTSSSGNNIGGSSRLIKASPGTVALSGGANAYTGVSTLVGGTLSVGTLANGGSPSDIGAAGSSAANLVFNGGALQYTGGAVTSDRLFTLATGGGAMDASGFGALNLNNAGSVGLSGTGARVLTLTGANAENNTFAASLGDSGGPTTLAKSGTGKWVLTGTNTHSGGTTISPGGMLQVGAGGASGSLGSGDVAANGTLVFNRTGTLIVEGAITGAGSVTNEGAGTVILAADNTYSGGTTISAGTLQVGNGGPSGSLFSSGPIENNSLLVFNTSGSFAYGSGAAGIISGTGNVIVQGGGTIKAIGNNTYTGWTRIDANTTFFSREGQDGALASSVVTNNGILRLVEQNGVGTAFVYPGPIVGSGGVQIGANNVNVGQVTLTGTNTYSGGTFIGGNELILGDGFTERAGAIVGDVTFVNNFTTSQDNPRTITFNRPDDFTFSGNITTNFSSPQNNLGIVQHSAFSTLTLTGNNTYGGGTVVAVGTLQVGNGGTSGSIGTGPATVNGTLAWNRSGDATFPGAITGAGAFVKMGSGTLALNGNASEFFGNTTVSNGMLLINGTNGTGFVSVYSGGLGGTGTISGFTTMDAGTRLAPGASVSSVGTLTFVSDLFISGDVAVDVNKSLPQINDMVSVGGGLINSGSGTVFVSNLGPGLAVGDKLTLFSQPLQGGASMTVTGAGATWRNDLAVDGSITATAVTGPPTLNVTRSGNDLQFSWSGSFKLQAQTNILSVGLSSNWGDYPGGATGSVNVPMGATPGAVFFRLAPTP